MLLTLAGGQYLVSLLRGTALPANTYWGLSSTTPTWEGTNITEPTDGNYARQAQAMTSGGWGAGTDTTHTLNAVSYHACQMVTGAEIVFPAPTANDGTMTHLVWYSAITGGSAYGYAALTASIVYTGGVDLRIAAGAAIMRLLGEAA